MKPLRKLLDSVHPLFAKGGKLNRLYPLYEAADTFLYTPGEVAPGPSHVRDAIDMKRVMGTVALSLIPCVLFALWNTGYQASVALEAGGVAQVPGWRGELLSMLGIGVSSSNWLWCFGMGATYFIPVFVVCNIVGGLWEVLFSIVRRHEINEGFLVTGMLFPLILPPTIPLWQVAMGISFGVVLGKEVFGGTGKNFLNPALTARAFLYFAYPAEISGDSVWVAADGYSAATPLGALAVDGMQNLGVTFQQAFLGVMPGSMGETSVVACLVGAAVLILTGVGSWRIMLSVVVSGYATAWALYAIGSDTNPAFQMPPEWHLVVGGFMFGAVFMATDPVSAAATNKGRWIYGALIGFLTVIIRVINPAFPEGVMLAILFGNVFAPLIDYYVVRSHIRRRALSYV